MQGKQNIRQMSTVLVPKKVNQSILTMAIYSLTTWFIWMNHDSESELTQRIPLLTGMCQRLAVNMIHEQFKTKSITDFVINKLFN